MELSTFFFIPTLLQVIRRHNEHPPLMQSSEGRLKAATYKEQPFCRSASESIGNVYSPAAADLKMQHLPQHGPRKGVSVCFSFL